jgi:hypothetical protein
MKGELGKRGELLLLHTYTHSYILEFGKIELRDTEEETIRDRSERRIEVQTKGYQESNKSRRKPPVSGRKRGISCRIRGWAGVLIYRAYQPTRGEETRITLSGRISVQREYASAPPTRAVIVILSRHQPALFAGLCAQGTVCATGQPTPAQGLMQLRWSYLTL